MKNCSGWIWLELLNICMKTIVIIVSAQIAEATADNKQ